MLLNEYFDLTSKCQIFTGLRDLNISRYLRSVLNWFKKSILKMGSSSHSHSFDLFPVPPNETLPQTIHPLPRFASCMKKSDKNQKCAHNEKHSQSAHHFATTLVLKYQPFLAGKMYIFGCSKYEMSSSRSNKTFHIANGIKLAKHRSCFPGFFFSKI